MSQDRVLTKKKLSTLWHSPDVEELDIEGNKYAIISDIHLGDGGGADDPKENEETLLTALGHYNGQGYQLMLLGDIEEFWQFDLDNIRRRYDDTVYKAIRGFGDERVHRVFGNHDLEWCRFADPAKSQSSVPASAAEALRMIDSQGVPRILLVHGHQGSTESDKNSWLSRAAVRMYKGVEPFVKFDRHASATKSQVTKDYEQILYSWAKESKVILICGHSHRAIFASESYADRLQDEIADVQAEIYANRGDKDLVKRNIKRLNRLITIQLDEKLKNRDIDPVVPEGKPVPCYFNTGCALFTDGITTIEMGDEEIRLVKWHKDTGKKPRFEVYQHGSLNSFIAEVANQRE